MSSSTTSLAPLIAIAKRFSPSTTLPELPSPETIAVLAPTIESAQGYVAAARAPRTRHEYAKQLRYFRGWCEAHGLTVLPTRDWQLALYLADLADRGWRPASISVALSAISQANVLAGFESPRRSAIVSEVYKGIRRTLGVAPNQKAPLSVEDVRKMVATSPVGIVGLRERALVTVGFAAGRRRSELGAVCVEDIVWNEQGMEILIRFSKTDQEGEGQLLVIPRGQGSTCPVANLRAWLDAANITAGPVFRSIRRGGRVGERGLTGHSIAKMIKAAAKRVGLDADVISGHSLRAGFVTEAVRGGADIRAIMSQTGHRSRAMIDVYDRRIKAWDRPAAGVLGL